MKIEKINKLLASGEAKDRTRGIAELQANYGSDLGTIMKAVPFLKKQINYSDLGVREKALDILLYVSRSQGQALVDCIPALEANVDLTLKRDRALVNHPQIAAKSVQLIKEICTKNTRAATPNTVVLALRVLQPPFYNPGVALAGSDKLTLEALSLIGTVAGLNPALLANPGLGTTIWKVFVDSYRFQRFKASGNRKGSMRWWCSYSLQQAGRAYPQMILPILIKGLAIRDPEIPSGAAQMIVSVIPSPQAFGQMFGYLNSPDAELAQYSSAAIAIVTQANPGMFVPVLINYMSQSGNTPLQTTALTIIGNVGLQGGQIVLNTLPTMVNYFKDTRPELRSTSVIAVAKLGSANPELVKNAIPHIISLLRDPDPRVKRSSVEAINIISKARPDLVKSSIPLLFENLAVPENRGIVGEVLLRFGININEYQNSLEYLQRVWGQVSNLVRMGVDCSSVETNMAQAREAIKTHQYPKAIELAKQAERMLGDLRTTSRPIMDLELTFANEPMTERWVVLDLNIINRGTAMARDLTVESPLFVNTQDLHIIGRVEAGKNVLMTIRWLPHIPGRVPLNLFIKYTDPFGKEDTVVKTFNIEIREAEPVHHDSPYKAGGYAFEHHEEVASYTAPEADTAAYAQTGMEQMEQEPHDVQVEDFHDKFEVDKSHTEAPAKSPAEALPEEQSPFDIDDIIAELMTQGQQKAEEEKAAAGALPQGEEHTVVTPSKVLMPKKPQTEEDGANEQSEN